MLWKTTGFIVSEMDQAELPIIVRKPVWPAVVVVIAAILGGAYLVMLPDIYSHPLRFGCFLLLMMIVSGGVGIITNRRPDLAISTDGIQVAEWGGAFVRWDEIERAFAVSHKGIDYICLSLRRADDFYARSGRLTKAMMTIARAEHLGDLSFRPASLGVDTQETVQLLNLLASWHGSDLKPPVSAVRYRTE